MVPEKDCLIAVSISPIRDHLKLFAASPSQPLVSNYELK